MLGDLLWLLLGFLLLISCGELLVKGGVALAYKARLSTLVVGMTVVSLGTSAPELLVSLKAAMTDYDEISIGNVVGSNIANIGLVLGTTVIIFPLAADRDTLRLDWPAMMLASFLFFFFIQDGTIQRWEGAIMLGGLIAYITYIVRRSRKRGSSGEEEPERISMSPMKMGLFLFLGILGLAFGSDLLIDGAVGIAEKAGVSEHVIAVTLVAFGTSVPELFTSTIAAFRKTGNISIGNLVGSNLFNLLFILGTVGLAHPLEIKDRVLDSDVYWMLGTSFLILPFMLIGRKIGRLEGSLLLLAYLAYIYFVLTPAIA